MNKKKVAIISIITILFIGVIVLGVKAFSKKESVNYVVSFNTDGGSFIESRLIKEKGKVTKPTDPVKAGLIMKGWYIGEELYDFNKEVTSNLILVAKWETPPVPTYVITFDSAGGSVVTTQSIEEGQTITKPTDPTKTGLEFVSWQLDGKDFDFDTKVTTNMTLTAKWQTPDNRLTVKFNSNGGSSVSSQKVEPGSKAKAPKTPTKSGYTFVEWQLNGAKYNFDTAVVSSITLKAVWKEQPVTYTYSVKWVKDEASYIGQYNMYVQRSDGTIVSGKIKVNYVDGGSDTFSVGTSGYKVIKASIGTASVVSPIS